MLRSVCLSVWLGVLWWWPEEEGGAGPDGRPAGPGRAEQGERREARQLTSWGPSCGRRVWMLAARRPPVGLLGAAVYLTLPETGLSVYLPACVVGWLGGPGCVVPARGDPPPGGAAEEGHGAVRAGRRRRRQDTDARRYIQARAREGRDVVGAGVVGGQDTCEPGGCGRKRGRAVGRRVRTSTDSGLTSPPYVLAVGGGLGGAVVGGVAANQAIRSRLTALCEERSRGEQPGRQAGKVMEVVADKEGDPERKAVGYAMSRRARPESALSVLGWMDRVGVVRSRPARGGGGVAAGGAPPAAVHGQRRHGGVVGHREAEGRLLGRGRGAGRAGAVAAGRTRGGRTIIRQLAASPQGGREGAQP